MQGRPCTSWATSVQQCIRGRLLDCRGVEVGPVVFGRGVRLLGKLDSGGVEVDLVRIVALRASRT
jgi:hypothetical protein